MLRWLLELFGYGDGPAFYATKLKTRKYYFDLPYTMSPSTVMYGVRMLKKMKLFDSLPKDIQLKMDHASEKWRSVTVHKDDLDRIDDKVWSVIAKKLGLRWE